jgi:hypothetical protein
MPTDDPTIRQIAEEHPSWHIWRSRNGDQPGELMATRRRNLTDHEMNTGLAQTLPMGYGTDLREQLAEQARRETFLGYHL